MATLPQTFVPQPTGDPVLDQNFQAVQALFAALGVFVGSGSPNGSVTASPGAVYRNLAGGAGASLYVKESGVNTNTGWVGK